MIVGCYKKPLAEYSIPIGDNEEFVKFGRKEIQAWQDQLKRTFPAWSSNFHIMRLEKDNDWSVFLEYKEEQQEEAFNVVEDLPYDWDEQAREKLGTEYFKYIKELRCPEVIKPKIDPFQKNTEASNTEASK